MQFPSRSASNFLPVHHVQQQIAVGLAMVAVAVLVLFPHAAQAQQTAFTYQAQLQQSGTPVDGTKDLEFKLYDSKTGGTQVGSAVTKQDVSVSNGVLTTSLDFGAVFGGDPLFIEVGVRDGSSTGAFTTLSPRTRIRPAPLAMALPNVRVTPDGNVGVATPSPSSPLTVNGTIESTSGGVKLPDGTVIQGSGDLGGGGGGLPTTGNGAFDLSNDAGVVAPGTFGTGSIPTTGAGTRMMWYPAKGAFRAGRVGNNKDGTQWDDSKVGEYSVAFGVDTKASGFGTTAMGQLTIASGDYATAMGFETTASGNGATAMGDLATASGNQTTAMGTATTASGDGATAMGSFTTASGEVSTAIGTQITAATDFSLSIGKHNSANTSADNTLFVAGNGSGNNSRSDALVLDKDGGLVLPGTIGTGSIPASGSGTRMMWYPAKGAFRAGRVGDDKDGTQWDASKVGDYSVALGVDTKASNVGATAIGFQATATGGVATALGDGTTASGEDATAMGSATTASGPATTSIGLRTDAATIASLSLGACNQANTATDGTLLSVGNGLVSGGNCSIRSDALVLKEDGDLAVGPSDPQDLRLHVTKDKANAGVSDSPGANMVLFENTNSGTNPDVLGLQAGPTDPGSGVTYVSFYQRDGTTVGTIEGNGSGGVNFNTTGSDYAEELPMRPGAATATPTDLVAVRGGEVTLDTEDTDRLMIVTDRAAVTGNAAHDAERPRVPVAFVGQVPVRLRGTANVGDLIVASGREDGTARAVAPTQYRPGEHGPIAGRAWSAKSSSGSGTVTVAVGLDQSGALVEQLQRQRTHIEEQNEQLQSQGEQLESLKERVRRLEALIQEQSNSN